MQDLPAPLRLSSPFPFVGRSAELEMLRALLPRAEGESRRFVLLGGEAGSGKSRLVREFAAAAARDGARVLYGACDAVVRTPYGPFIEALDRLVRVLEPDELHRALSGGSGALGRLLPDLPARLGEPPPPAAADPDTERHRLHMVVSDLLDTVGRRRPVVLAIEDGHWADASTLLLLRHLARAAGTTRLLVLSTFRDDEANVPAALAQTLADLRRSEDVVRFRLRRLSEGDLDEFVRRAGEPGAGLDVKQLSRAISELTGGNAFLVCELWRALVETGFLEVVDGATRLARPLAELGTPESVREVVNQRLARLAPTTGALLELAATSGGEFELEILRRSAVLAEPELLAALDEAVRSGIIEELPSRRLAYRFAHELVRRAVYDRLTAVRRAELHLRIGEAEEAAGGRSARALADLAHHFEAAAPLGERSRAIEYNLLAARAAGDALAFDDAAARLRTALELGIESAGQRAEALIDLGSASHRGGKVLDALEAFRDAAGVARELGDAELLARAAIGYEDAGWRPQVGSRDTIPLVEEALEALGDHERAALVRSDAVELARRLHDRAGLATVLARSYWSQGTSSLEEIIQMLTEAKAIAGQLGDNEIRAEAMAWRVTSFVALGDIASARAEVAALRQTAEATGQPFVLHMAEHFGSAIALSDGRLDEAEAMARHSDDAGRLLTGRDASGTHGIQMFNLRREQGRLAELAPVVRILAGGRDQGQWRPGLVALLAELGMETEARAELARIAAAGLEPFRESLWLASLTYIADAASALDDEATAALVYPALEPQAGANVMIGHLVSYHGAADRYLGMLARTLGDWDRAEQHLERALALNRAMEAETWLAHTEYEYARLLVARGDRDRRRISALLGAADERAAAIGMRALRTRIRRAGATPVRERRPDGLSPREAQILRLVARGLSNREIGASLYISEHTTANHIRAILRKTGCANRTEAASYAHRHALVDG
jgi:predicted ATPase/DNA-binding CsgD family transcriptional regulator